jgi:hypothetical protein
MLKTLISTGASLTIRAKCLINNQFGADLEVGKKRCIFFSIADVTPSGNQTDPT